MNHAAINWANMVWTFPGLQPDSLLAALLEVHAVPACIGVLDHVEVLGGQPEGPQAHVAELLEVA